MNLTVHAEQAAIANAAMHREQAVSLLAVSATPCGHCRQFLFELVDASNLRILHPQQPPSSLRELLPSTYGPNDLGVQAGLLGPPSHTLPVHSRPGGDILLAGWEAMRISYAPYSRAYAGAALRTHDGRIFAGPYLENAAFNPSLLPMQAAVAMALLAGYGIDDFIAASLVHPTHSQIDHAGPARLALAGLSPDIPLQTLLVPGV